MSKRYALELAYDGTAYCGWQIQPNAITVQEVLQKSFSTLLREEISVLGCGRTDTGVHAKYFVAHIDTSKSIENIDKLIYKINGFLPKDIVIFNIKEVIPEFHARFSATSRSYEYHVVTQKTPFLNTLTYKPNFSLDFDLMNTAAKHLLDFEDFTSFSKLHTDVHTNNCDVTFAEWEKMDDNHWVFHISANRFLRNMVRAIVGTLFDVGKGKITVEQFCDIIRQKDRGVAGVSVPAQALYLTDIIYPEDLKVKS